MKGFLWIAACGAAAVVGATVREAPSIIDNVRDYVVIENDGETVRIGSREGAGDSEFDRAKAQIESSMEGDAAIDAEAEAAAQLEALTAATTALEEADADVTRIAADEELSADERAEQLAAALARRDEAREQIETIQASAEEGDAAEQISGGLEQAINGVITAVEQSDVTIERDGRELTGAEREAALDEARDGVREAMSELRDEIRDEANN